MDLGLLAALGFAWGSAYIFIREGIVLGASPVLYAAVRYLLSAGVFAALAVGRRTPVPDRRSLKIAAVVGGPFLIGLYGGFLYLGEQYTTGGYAAVLSCTAPILTVLAAYILLPGERLGRGVLGGILLGFVGVVLLVVPALLGSATGGWLGPPLIIGAFLTTAIASVLLRRLNAGRQGLWHLAVQFAVGGLVLMAVLPVLPGPERLPLTWAVGASLLALVAVSSVLGYFVYFTLHHRVGPVRANVVAYLLPVVGLGIGSGFFGEPVGLFEIAGVVVVLAGVTLVSRAGR